nr:DUF4190 domain-containing protein [Gordonia araii]
MAIAALVVGLAGIVTTFCLFFTGLVSGITALVLGLVALKQIRDDPTPDSTSKNMAIGGIVLGALQLLVPIVGLIIMLVSAMAS